MNFVPRNGTCVFVLSSEKVEKQIETMYLSFGL